MSEHSPAQKQYLLHVKHEKNLIRVSRILLFLVNGDNYFVCRMYGTDSQDSGYSVSCLGNDSADSGSCPVPDHELDDDAGVG